MIAVLIRLTPARRKKFIDCQQAKVRIVVLQIMDVKTCWNSTQVLLEQAYRLRECTHESLQNPKYSDYPALFTTQDEWTIVKYVMEVSRPFLHWTLSMWKRHAVTLHQVITNCNDKFDQMDGLMQALPRKKTQWKEDLYFTIKLARMKQSKFYDDMTPTMGMLLISAHILDPLWKLQSLRKSNHGMDINSENEISYTTQYREAFLM